MNPGSEPTLIARDRRLAALLETEYAFVWRCVRRFGVAESNVDDVVQEAFVVVARKVDCIAEGKERAFLTQVALRLAANWRRAVKRRREDQTNETTLEQVIDGRPSPEECLDHKRQRRWLDEALAVLPLKLRAPFVLSALEGLSRAEVAQLLELPEGTVATRVRAARRQFEEVVRRRVEGDPAVARQVATSRLRPPNASEAQGPPSGAANSDDRTPLFVSTPAKKVFG